MVRATDDEGSQTASKSKLTGVLPWSQGHQGSIKGTLGSTSQQQPLATQKLEFTRSDLTKFGRNCTSHTPKVLRVTRYTPEAWKTEKLLRKFRADLKDNFFITKRPIIDYQAGGITQIPTPVSICWTSLNFKSSLIKTKGCSNNRK